MPGPRFLDRLSVRPGSGRPRALRPRAAKAILLAVVLGASAVRGEDAADRLRGEAERRTDALVHDGYNLTQGWSLGPAKETPSHRLELFVPGSGDELTFTFWAETAEGGVAFHLLGPNGATVASWSGRKGESTLSLAAPVGKYVVEIDRTGEGRGRAILGVKGPVLRRCELPSGSVEERAASPARGFRWPYLLFLPKEIRARRLLVVPNNTGFSAEDPELLRMSGSCEMRRQVGLAERLGTPLLVPLFPRPAVAAPDENLYLHALTRASLLATSEAVRRVDLQLLAMIDDARAALHGRGVEVEPAVLLWGFSASGSFVNRFAVLHPERVTAVACGSPGGWPIAPVRDVEGEELPYPVGVADLRTVVGRPLDAASLKRVAWLFFLGDQDENDAVPYRDSFSKADEDLVFRRFGPTPVSRWRTAERLYAKAGLRARFELYRGAAHSVTPEMAKDVALFFESVLGACPK